MKLHKELVRGQNKWWKIFLHNGSREAYSSFCKDRQEGVHCLILHTCLNVEPYSVFESADGALI